MKTKEFIDKNLLKINLKLLQLEEDKDFVQGKKFDNLLNKIYNLQKLEENLIWFKELYNAKISGKYKIAIIPKEQTNDC